MNYTDFIARRKVIKTKRMDESAINYLGWLTLNSDGSASLAPTRKVKDTAEQAPRDELQQAIAGSSDILATAKTTMTLFPDTVTLDREQLTVTVRNFIRTAEVMSLRVQDILNVTAVVGPIFGSIKIVSRVMNTDQPAYTIGVFWRSDALRLKKIIQGYVIAMNREIDTRDMPIKELVGKLEEIGEDTN